MPSLTPVEIVNRALAKFGGGRLSDLSDETPLGEAARLVYADTIEGLLSEHPWAFSVRTVELAALNEPVDNEGLLAQGYTKVFQIPAPNMGPPVRVFTNPRMPDIPLKEFLLEEDRLYCDQARVWAQMPLASDPEAWPGHFRDAAIACLAAELLMPVTGNSAMLDSLRAYAWGSPAENRLGGKLGAAKRVDNRAKPSRVLTGSDPLTSARWR